MVGSKAIYLISSNSPAETCAQLGRTIEIHGFKPSERWRKNSVTLQINTTFVQSKSEQKHVEERRGQVPSGPIGAQEMYLITLGSNPDRLYYLAGKILMEADREFQDILRQLKQFEHRSAVTFDGQSYESGDTIARAGTISLGSSTRAVILEVEYLACPILEKSAKLLAEISEPFLKPFKSALTPSSSSSSSSSSPPLHTIVEIHAPFKEYKLGSTGPSDLVSSSSHASNGATIFSDRHTALLYSRILKEVISLSTAAAPAPGPSSSSSSSRSSAQVSVQPSLSSSSSVAPMPAASASQSQRSQQMPQQQQYPHPHPQHQQQPQQYMQQPQPQHQAHPQQQQQPHVQVQMTPQQQHQYLLQQQQLQQQRQRQMQQGPR